MTRLHIDNLRRHIIKKTHWSQSTFDLIHWNAHGTAFKQLTTAQQISTAKLIHQLANTNRQNHLYYKTSPTCPCCQEAEETFEHVLLYPAEAVANHREIALQELTTSLEKLATPPPVVEAIIHGTLSWLNHSHDGTRAVRAQVAGSLRAADVLLTSAFQEQYHTVGWFQLFLGRISLKWEKAAHAYCSREGGTLTTAWSSNVIHQLWRFTRSMWNNRNSIVHGKDAETAATRILQDLYQQVRTLYEEYQSNPNIILSRHQHLFTSRTLNQRLQHSYDNITCWIRSVNEAKLALAHHVQQLSAQSSSFFTPAQFISHARLTEEDSLSESYVPSSNASISTYTTLYTTTTQETSSVQQSLSSTSITNMSFLSLTNQHSYSSDPPSVISWDASTSSTFP